MIANLILIILSCQGYWFSGARGEIVVRWAIDKPPQAFVAWDLAADGATLASGRIDMPPGNADAVIRIIAPQVRVRTKMIFNYKLIGPRDNQVLATGHEFIDVFPKDLLSGLATRTKGKSILLVDESKALSDLLLTAKIEHSVVSGVEKIPMKRPDIIIVVPGQLHGRPFEQSALLGHAAAGASVMILAQPDVKTLGGYAIEARKVPVGGQASATWTVNRTHPLLQGMTEADIRGLLASTSEFRAVQLPADEAAMEIVYWPREAPGKEPVPIDALLLTTAVGSGRLVLCQVPLGPWDLDPRSQLLLAGALDYLPTRAEPTPRPSERPKSEPANPVRSPNILVPSGANP